MLEDLIHVGYTRIIGRIVAVPERVSMFSPNEIGHVAWFLVLLIAAWILVNALVDVSGERRRRRAADEHLDSKND